MVKVAFFKVEHGIWDDKLIDLFTWINVKTI